MKKLTFCLLVLWTIPVAGEKIPYDIIRVGIIQNSSSVHVSCPGGGYVYDLTAGTQSAETADTDVLVEPMEDGGISLEGKQFHSPIRIVLAGTNDLIRINGKRFHDSIVITAKNGKLTVVNELGLEDYICGILPEEANAAWPLESLKAQAVVSRTYVLKNMRRHEKNGFDVCNSDHCQVYGGAQCEDPRSNKAVELTRGEVLMYNGQMAQTLFHASCGGHTENPNNVWAWESATPPYLRGVTDKYCLNSPHQHWKNIVKEETIRKSLVKAGFSVGTITSIKVEGTNVSGRAKKLKIKSTNGVVEMKGSTFRMAIDPWIIRSTMFKKITKKGESFEFTGYGWGHGVGMCQWGAKEMAEHGKDYTHILNYYYPGTNVKKMEQ
ncbi:MAG: SpoIID/LytB domain-containing protein [Endomicrobiales bacterium]